MSSENPKNIDFSLLLASSVHDMKNSLGMLLASLDEVMDDFPAQNEQQKDRYAILQAESSRLRNDLLYLLSLYRIDQNRLRLHTDADLDVLEFIDHQLAINAFLFQHRDIDVEVECEDQLIWHFDEELIAGVINNVLVNASKYANTKLKIIAQIEDNQLHIQVQDDGRGYPQMMLDALAAYEEGVEFSTGSTKLGLFFSAKIAKMHEFKGRNGSIKLENTDVGSTFHLYLP